MREATRSIRPWQTAVPAIALALVVIASPALAQIPCSYTVQEIPAPPPCIWGPRPISPGGISPNGRYVSGQYEQCSDGYTEACVFDAETWHLITIPRPAGVYSAWCNDVNDSGVAVGGCWNSATGMRGWMYQLPNGPWVELTTVLPNSPGDCEVLSINSSGAVCGYRSTGNTVNPQNAFYWSAQQGYTDLGVMNGPNSSARKISDTEIVVGWTGINSFATGDRGFIHVAGKTAVFGPAPGAVNSSCINVDTAGRVLVVGLVPTGPGVVYLYDSGEFEQLLPLPEFASLQVRGMSNNQTIVGNSGAARVGAGPTVWFGQTSQNLNAMAAGSPLPLQFGRDVSDTGRIVARGIVSNGQELAYLLKPQFPSLGDTNCDNVVNVIDLLEVIGSWGPCGGCPSDFNADGNVNVPDLLIVIEGWG